MTTKVEGFWATVEDQVVDECLPWPIARRKPWKGRRAFLQALEKLEAGKFFRVRFYKGSSVCRLCKSQNGSDQHFRGRWTWPSGLRHYVVVHNVKPSREFISFVLKVAGSV